MRRVILFGVLAVALVAGFFVARNLTGTEKSGAPRNAGPARGGSGGSGAPLPVYTHTVATRVLQERITATGTLSADEAVDLVSELSGKVVSIRFQEGSRVARGDVLIAIDDSELRAQLARAESRVALARSQAERQKQLGVGLGTTQEAYDAALSETRVLEAEVEVVRAQLAKTILRAPFDGLIGLRYVSEGAFVTPTTRIASLQKVDPIKVDFTVAERHLDRLQRDAKVRISVAGIDTSFEGEIFAIEPRIDITTRMLRLRARAPNPAGRALPGGFATVELPLRETPDAITIPADALVAGLNQQQVFVIESGRAQPRVVELGIRLPREVQIVSGLKAGDVVITSGQLQLRPNMPVKAVARDDKTPPGTVTGAGPTGGATLAGSP
jgi:membrane fusion protein, multidrug efflux system